MGALHDIEIAGVRVDQSSLLGDECLIWRVTDPGTISKIDATYSNPSTTTIYSGPCDFAPIVARRDRFDVHGEQQVYQNQNRVLLPWDSFDIRIGDLLRVTATEDEDLLLKDQVIKDVLMASDVTLRRLTTIDIDE